MAKAKRMPKARAASRTARLKSKVYKPTWRELLKEVKNVYHPGAVDDLERTKEVLDDAIAAINDAPYCDTPDYLYDVLDELLGAMQEVKDDMRRMMPRVEGMMDEAKRLSKEHG